METENSAFLSLVAFLAYGITFYSFLMIVRVHTKNNLRPLASLHPHHSNIE
jgi:hypothetical protein